jgi:hypothetical protein
MGYWYRVSSSCGTKTLGSLIASSAGGAGSPLRVYNWIYKYNNVSPRDYFFNYLGGSLAHQGVLNYYNDSNRQNYFL